jgi:hypothetical protein
MQSNLWEVGKSFAELANGLDVDQPNLSRLQSIARDLLGDNQQIIEPVLVS